MRIQTRAFRALLRRNLIIRKRRWISSLLEFCLPILAVSILLILKASVKDSDSFSATVVEPISPSSKDTLIPFSFQDYVTTLQAQRICINTDLKDTDYFEISGLPDKGYNWPVPFVKCDSRSCKADGESAFAYCEYNQLSLSPSTPDDIIAGEMVDRFAQYIHTRYPQTSDDSVALPFTYNFIRTDIKSNAALDDYVTRKDYGESGVPKIGVAVVFSSTEKKSTNPFDDRSTKTYNYAIRVNSTNFNTPEEELEPAGATTPPTDQQFRSYAKNDNEACQLPDYGPVLGPYENSCTGQYMYNGAITIQRLVNDWIMHDTGANEKGYSVAENAVRFVSFPTRKYTKDGFYAQIAPFAPLLVFLGLIFPVSVIIRSITQEKELRQQELMKMMSISQSAIGWSWFVSFFLFYFFSAIFTAAATSGLYSNSSFGFLFVFWELSFLATITYAFLIAACFSKATRATLVGLLGFFIGFILAISLDYTTLDKGLINFVSLHPVAAFSFGLQAIGDLEDFGVGVNKNTFRYSDHPSGYAMSDSVKMLVVDSIVWGILAWYLNRVVRGDYGQPLPLSFPFQVEYWCPRRIKSRQEGSGIPEEEALSDRTGVTHLFEDVSDALKEQKKEGRSVELYNLTKQFGPKTAVDRCTLSMYSGQVTALLGHNGAGKTTIISMLTGMLGPTSGYAEVAGRDIRTDMPQIRNEVGICLQHNCLFPLLTVEEHVEFFARVRGIFDMLPFSEARAHVQTAIEDVALLDKRYTLSKDLSGGMKRKLSVAIAFCGDSKVVFLDEPTSGMDPFSRRFTWNVIRQYREGRCIILTTHFMDEADLLGDRVAIMAEGQLRCVGSPFFLKKAFGVGYQLTIEKEAAQDKPEDHSNIKNKLMNIGSHNSWDQKLIAKVQDAVNEATVLSNVGTELSFQLPIGASENFLQMFDVLDECVQSREIVTYGMSVTTLDEVFLMVARGEIGQKSDLASVRSSEKVQAHKTPLQDDNTHCSSQDIDDRSLFANHMRALFWKRAMNFKRDKKAWCFSTILPTIFALVGFIIVKFASPNRNMESLHLSLADANPGITTQRNPINFNAPGSFECSPGVCAYQPQMYSNETNESYNFCGSSAQFGFDTSCESDYCGPICDVRDSEEFMLNTIEDGASPESEDMSGILESSENLLEASATYLTSQYGALLFTHDTNSTVKNGDVYSEAAFEACVQQHGNYTLESQCSNFKGIGYTVQYNFTSLHSSLIFQGIADQAILREAQNDDAYTISTAIYPLPLSAGEVAYAQSSDAVPAWILIVLSFPFVMASFATFVVKERSSKAKHLQTVAGVKRTAYYLSTYLWDILNYQLPVWMMIMLLFAFDIKAYTTTDRGVIGGVIITLLLFGPAAAGFTYCCTFSFDSSSMCSLFVILFNFIIGMAGPLVCLNFRFFAANTEDDLSNLLNVARIIEWILRIFPSFCLGKALLYAQFIESWSQIYAKPDLTVWSEQGVLIEVIFLLFQSVIYIWLAINIDKLSTNPRAVRSWKIFVSCIKCANLCKKSQAGEEVEEEDAGDVDVLAEEDRVALGADEDVVILHQLTKQYDSGKLAVKNVSLGIPAGQCFGLLGTNGAGKTTLMACLTAEFPITSGDATISGFSVTNEPDQTRKRIGYCPQFDALFSNMTGLEHVVLYAMIKGVKGDAAKEVARETLEQVGLNEEDSDRLSSRYSGGMKRKLSVACALIGHPQIVFLDEPSTGMDPVARRDLWKVISDMVVGDEANSATKISVILTTHSMEECEALCPRIGIMAGGKLRCLGSAQHLKSRFGKGFQVEVKLRDAHDEDEDFRSTLLKIFNNLEESLRLSSRRVIDIETEGGEGVLVAAQNTFLQLNQAKLAAGALTDDGYLATLIASDNSHGYMVYKNAITEIGVTVDELAAFCVDEIRIRNVLNFFSKTYANSILRERQDKKVRFEIDSEGVKVSSLFRTIEDSREHLMLADYSVSQTSLEQVFNIKAAEAEAVKRGNTD